MTQNRNWPDPNRLGYPLFSGQDGLHVVMGPFYHAPVLVLWNAIDQKFLYNLQKFTPQEMMDARIVYYGANLSHPQIKQLLEQERERCVSVCKTLITAEEGRYGVGLKTTGATERIQAYARVRRLIGCASEKDVTL